MKHIRSKLEERKQSWSHTLAKKNTFHSVKCLLSMQDDVQNYQNAVFLHEFEADYAVRSAVGTGLCRNYNA